jgi:hypothetical protein
VTGWLLDPQATEAAREAFPGSEARVLRRRDGNVYLIEGTARGRVELVKVAEGYVAAAEHPPEDAAPPALRIPERLRQHFNRNRLHPWQRLPETDVIDAIRGLNADAAADTEPGEETLADETEDSEGPTVMQPLARHGALVGETRHRLADSVADLLDARCSRHDPIVGLAGLDGVGKCAVAAEVAAICDYTAVELPLSRALIERVFQTREETVIEAAAAAAKALGDDGLLAVTDADLLLGLDDTSRHQILRELGRVRRVLLIGQGMLPLRGVIGLGCPGIGAGDVPALLAAHELGSELVGAAPEMLVRAATVEGVGVVAARVLYLARLAAGRAESPAGCISPDEVTAAVALAGPSWR